MTAKTKLRIKKLFVYDLWRYLLVISSVCLCCYISGKWAEGIAFVIAHLALRYKFDYQYHSKSHCMLLTNLIIWIGILKLVKISLSLLATIFMAFFVCWVGNEVQEKIFYSAEYVKILNSYNKMKNKTQYTDRQKAIIDGKAKGLKGESLINYVIGLGYDCSERTLAREVAKIKEIEGMA